MMTNETDPCVSVVIPTFNRADQICETIGSVLAQSYQNLEVVVVDDASTDNTGNLVEAISDPRVRYIRLAQNSGPSIARNTGIEQATGTMIALLDSDDNWHPKKIEQQIAAIRNAASFDNIVSFTKAEVLMDNHSEFMPKQALKPNQRIGDFILRGKGGLVATSSVMLTRKLALSTPFSITQKHWEDWDFFLRLEGKGAQWLYVDEVLTIWNNESRDDRLSLSPDDGSEWLEDHKQYLSENARKAFYVKGIVRPLIQSRNKKWYAFKLLSSAFSSHEISLVRYLKLGLKIFIPPCMAFRKRW